MAYGQYRQRGMYPPMQGGGFYSPYSKSPQWGAGIQQIMQQIAMKKQMNQQQQQQMQQQQQQQEQEQWKRGIVEREITLKEQKAQEKPGQTKWDFQKQYAKYMIETQQWDNDQAATYLARNEVPQKLIELPAGEMAKIEKHFKIKDFNQLPPNKQIRFIELYASKKRPKPTQFDRKKTEWDRKLKTGEATQSQYDEVVWGVRPKPTKEEVLAKGANPRQANATWLKDVYKNVDTGAIEKEAKKAKARPSVRGVALDMPYKYNLAILNREDRVETPEDLDTIAKYEVLFRYFSEKFVKKALSFKEFLLLPEAKNPNLDKKQIRRWYEMYEGILYEAPSFIEKLKKIF